MPNQYSYSSTTDIGIIYSERIVSNRFITESGCWIWMGSTVKGYGQVSIDGAMYKVHRVIASLCLGLDLENPETHVLHKCDTPACFNPDHLYLGDEDANHQDIFDRERFGASFKLTPEDVANIFKMKDSGMLQKDIAEYYNVNSGTISRILSGERWSRLNRKGR